MKRLGFAQIPLMIGLLLMAIAVPAATKLVQENQTNRGKAYDPGDGDECKFNSDCEAGYFCKSGSCVKNPVTPAKKPEATEKPDKPTSKPTKKPSSTPTPSGCIKEGGTVASGTADCCSGLTKQDCGGSGTFQFCYCKKPTTCPTGSTARYGVSDCGSGQTKVDTISGGICCKPAPTNIPTLVNYCVNCVTGGGVLGGTCTSQGYMEVKSGIKNSCGGVLLCCGAKKSGPTAVPKKCCCDAWGMNCEIGDGSCGFGLWSVDMTKCTSPTSTPVPTSADLGKIADCEWCGTLSSGDPKKMCSNCRANHYFTIDSRSGGVGNGTCGYEHICNPGSSPFPTRTPISKPSTLTPTSRVTTTLTPTKGTSTPTPKPSSRPTPMLTLIPGLKCFCQGVCNINADCVWLKNSNYYYNKSCNNSMCNGIPQPSVTPIKPSSVITRPPMPLTKVPTQKPTKVPTDIPSKKCTACPSTFACYKNGSEYKWFGKGMPMNGFTLTNDADCSGIEKPSYKGKSRGDANCDGSVDVVDYSLWHKEFFDGGKGSTVKSTWYADFTGSDGKCDGRVDTYDFSLWQKYFNELKNI